MMPLRNPPPLWRLNLTIPMPFSNQLANLGNQLSFTRLYFEKIFTQGTKQVMKWNNDTMIRSR
jgi:hypothetical protein